ncbi:MAG: FtsX-like permease family protein [Candidatus Magasanikbacteria bacterium]|nr:FtsX-like permease family protein [Candidatus Magasanikbacteria bacterium]
MLSFFRVLKFALQDLWRNISLSFMTVFILILMLLSVNTLWSLDVLTKQAVEAVKKQIDVSIYFVPEATEKNVTEIKNYVMLFPEVTDVRVQTKEQVLADFREKHKNQKEALEALDELGANPFGPTMIIKTKEPKDYKKIIDALNVPEYESIIEAKSFDNHEEAITRLQNITNRIERVGFGLTILFALISFLIIFNTIRVAIATQKVEIGIKRLVGASNWFIRGPYLVESVIFTIISVSCTIGLVYLALRWIDPYLAVILPNGFSLTNYFYSNMLMLFGAQALAVLLLTVLSSLLAMRKQLKV